MAVNLYRPAADPPRPLTCFIYGAPRRAKTSLAASFPRPIVISAGVEGGDRTLQLFPDTEAIRVRNRSEVEEAVRFVQLNRTAHGWQTVVIDSITFILESVIAEFSGVKADKTYGKMDQQAWGRLESWLTKWLMPTLHALPMHIVWIALEKQIMDRESGVIVRTEPMIPGGSSQKLPACCDLILYADTMAVVPQGGGQPYQAYCMRTSETPGRAICGGRFGPVFPEGYLWPNFRAIAERIGPQIGVSLAAPQPQPQPQPQLQPQPQPPQSAVAAGGAV